MPNVSIIVPVYNGEKYIRQCLDSLMNQTLNDYEVLVINDGSTDSTSAILEEYETRYNFVRVLTQENRGLYRTRERGIAEARGTYIGWVDADDYVEPDMFAVLYDTAIKNNSDMVYCDYDFFPAKGRHKNKWYRPYNGKKDVHLMEVNSQPWNKLARKAFLNELEIGRMIPSCFDEAYIKALLFANNLVSIDRELYHYRMGTGSMSTSFKNVAHYERFIQASKALEAEMLPLIKGDQYWEDYFGYRIDYYLMQTLVVAANANDKHSFVRIKKEIHGRGNGYTHNQHFWPVMTRNYGKLKSFILGTVIPMNFYLSRLICKIAFAK